MVYIYWNCQSWYILNWQCYFYNGDSQKISSSWDFNNTSLIEGCSSWLRVPILVGCTCILLPGSYQIPEHPPQGHTLYWQLVHKGGFRRCLNLFSKHMVFCVVSHLSTVWQKVEEMVIWSFCCLEEREGGHRQRFVESGLANVDNCNRPVKTNLYEV